jgi:hypothetical protein
VRALGCGSSKNPPSRGTRSAANSFRLPSSRCGPLVFSERLSRPADEVSYRAGDSLGFIDPFTGSGILNAMLTGELAGIAAARGAPAASYLRDCRRLLRRPFLVSSVFRTIIASGHAGLLAGLVPGRFLFHATRPSGLKLGA